MSQGMTHIRVPGSTSNLGPGFDSIGVALNIYLDISFFPSESWLFIPKSEDVVGIPKGKDNLIYQAALYTAKAFQIDHIPPQKVQVKSSIPMARGLGSSAAAIVAGIEVANHVLNLQLQTEDKIQLASNYEGHPDNVVPSILGGCIIAHQENQGVHWVKMPVEKVCFLAIVPQQMIKTNEARAILPDELPFEMAVEASAAANVFIAALAQGNWALAGEMMEKDRFHQVPRKRLISHYDELKDFMEGAGAFGTFLSGAGPTMTSLVGKEKVKDVSMQGEVNFPEFQWLPLHVDNDGIQVHQYIKTAGE